MSKALIKQLHEACTTGNLDFLLTIIYHNKDEAISIIRGTPLASSPSRHDESWDTLRDFLHIASSHGHLEIVKQLIEFGADVNGMSVRSQTPLSAACENGHIDVARLLICKGAEVDPSEVNFEQSPIYLACLEGHIDMIELLISKKPSVLQRSGQVLLYTAAYEGHLEVVKFLIKRRVNINPPRVRAEIDGAQVMLNSLGSPLYGACEGKQPAVAQYLIENGAMVTVKIVETFWEFLVEVLMRYTKDAKARRKTALSFESDPEIKTYAACWGSKNICSLHKGWFVNLSARLVSIDLGHNNLEELPEELFNILPVLEELDVSHNKLIFLPEINQTGSFTSLEKLFVQNNQLTYVPSSLFQIKTLKKVNLSYNKITNLEDDDDNSDMYISWRCPGLRVLKLNHNCLSSLPNGIQSASGLVKLFVNNNRLNGFPMPWKCPLELLDLSHNKLTVFNYNVEMVWASSLRYLNLSYNMLDCISWNICRLSGLMDLDVSHNSIKSLPVEKNWTCFSLHKLNLSFNKLSAKMLSEGAQSNTLRQRLFKSPSQDDGQETKTDAELPVELFSPTLETLFLNNNCLQVVPLSVCHMTNLIELDLSNNVDLKTLPPQLGNLRDCWQLRLTNLNLTGLPKHVRPGGIGVRPKDTLAFLRATLRKSVPYYRMKLMVVGIQGYGKTTLLAALKGQNLPKNISTVGIVIDEWNVQLGSGSWFPLSRLMSQSAPPSITFSTWDLAGQSVYYAAHQMFLSPSTLYLGVWNVTLGEEGIESLRQWLLNIKARAQYSDVLIVGTHVDMLPKKNRETRIDKLKQIVMNKYADSKGFPKIVGNIVVSATTGENIQELREMIYSKAMKAREQGENVIGKQVPLSYIQLQESVMKEAERRRATGEPPILLEEEILKLASKNKDNDILDHEELTLATRFLHENGVLLHYNDQLRGLNTLYFIDPSWVCDLIANIVTVRERNPFIREGIMWKSNVALVLKDPRFPSKFISQYLQLMERFEIALSLDDNRLLIPSMLPPDSPGMQLDKLYRMGGISRRRAKTEHKSRPATEHDNESAAECKAASLPRFRPGHKEKIKFSEAIKDDIEEDDLPKGPVDAVRRNYQMAYIPSGFWSRLITRLMVSLQRWRTSEGIEEERFSMIYWRKGIGVVYEGGHFLVQSYRELIPLHAGRNRFEELEGVAIEVWSGLRDFSVMGFIVDQVDALISEWYPGLDDTDNFGYPLVRRLIPCPQCINLFARRGSYLRRSCSVEFPTEHCGTQPVRPYNFTLPTCAAAALNFATINCPYHPETVVSLDELIPDLLMTDLPRNLLVDRGEFKYNTDASSRLGGGGAGEVFRGVLDDMEVAVKTFHSTRTTRYLLDSGIGGASTDGSSTGTFSGPSFRGRRSEGSSMRRAGVFRGECSPQEENMEDELEKTKVVRAFWDLRQEVAVLCHLRHPCVVKLLGVCLHPLCFLLELAPQGSLASVLEEMTLGREKDKKGINTAKYETKDSILGRAMTYKMTYQVISALWYLHDSDIIYRDLKADNILVWSLDDSDLINVKLSDYGISCFATPQGVAGDEGTPGYQAPEIRTGIGYDEKVDIFSFAIFLYELISGVRPYRDFRSAVDIKKAIRRNVRPSLEDQGVDSQLPRLESVMVSSWSELPERRPNAEQTLRDLEEPEFLCHYRTMPKPEEGVLEKITSVYGLVHSGTGVSPPGPSNSQSSGTPASLNGFVLLWSRERDRRQYSMLNCDTGVFYYKDESCPGHRVLCMVRVGSRTWLGTEGCTIEVFGKRNWRLPSTLCSFIVKAPVLALLTQEAKPSMDTKNETKVDRVYAALANGTLIVFTHENIAATNQTHDDVKRFYDESDDVISQEMDQWKEIQVINLGQSSNPVKSMVLTKENEELWVSCGNQIIVMNTQTLSIIKEIPVYSSQRAHVRKMVACDDRVWSIDRRSTKILQWDVHTHHLTHVFDLEVENPIMKSVCKSFCETEGVDIGEEDAKRQGDTVPRVWRNRADTNRPPPYPGDGTNAAKTLVDRALGSETRLSRSGALKSRSSSPLSASVPDVVVDKPDEMEPEESPALGEKAEGISELASSGADTRKQAYISEATETLAKNVCPADEESLLKDIPQEDEGNTGNISLGTSVDSGCYSELSIKSVDSKALNDTLLTLSETKDKQEEKKQDSENNNDDEATFEVVNRTEIVVEAAKERRENSQSLSIEAASMSSLTAKPKSISRGPSMMRSRKKKSLRHGGAQASTSREPSRPRLHVMTGSVNKVMAVLHTGGTLWVGRGKGDVIVINVDSKSNTYFYGEVIAQLKCENFLHFASGQVDEIIQSGNNKIVCLRRLEPVRLRKQEPANKSGQFPGHQDPSTERYQLIVWEAWGRREFESFKSYLDRFNDLVDQ